MPAGHVLGTGSGRQVVPGHRRGAALQWFNCVRFDLVSHQFSREALLYHAAPRQGPDVSMPNGAQNSGPL